MADLAENTEALEAELPVPRLFQQAGLLRSRRRQRRSSIERVRSRRAIGACCASGFGPAVLFERDANGRERLISEAGKERLDSAMSQFVNYPENSPFVVEGYARGR